MVAWPYRGLRRGVVTSRYPRVVDTWTRGLPSPPSFRPDLLTRQLASRLSAACPAGALTVEAGDLLVDLGRCTACGRCIELGEGAAAPSGEFLLATRDRRSLVKRVPIAGDPEVDGDRR